MWIRPLGSASGLELAYLPVPPPQHHDSLNVEISVFYPFCAAQEFVLSRTLTRFFTHPSRSHAVFLISMGVFPIFRCLYHPLRFHSASAHALDFQCQKARAGLTATPWSFRIYQFFPSVAPAPSAWSLLGLVFALRNSSRHDLERISQRRDQSCILACETFPKGILGAFPNGSRCHNSPECTCLTSIFF